MNLETSREIKSLYRIGGTAALPQLAAILGYAVIAVVLGPKPAGAEAYFAVYLESPTAAALRGDLLLLILIGLYLGTFPALYVALRRSPVYTALATLFTVMAVVGAFATESTFSPIQMFMGIFYFVWSPMLAWDFFRLAKEQS